jgi:DNA-binding GntR family transcriptional regulator
VYGEIRADIIAGEKLPGAKLRFAELSAEYSAGMGVVREALNRLVAEGLVDSAPQRGFFVTRVSAADLADITEARVIVEALVLRRAVENGTVEWESDCLAAHHRLANTPRALESAPNRLSTRWADAHRDFHRTLLMTCPNRRLFAYAEALRDAAEIYRNWSALLVEDRDIDAEHLQLLQAVLSRDPEAAEKAIVAHIRQTSDLLLGDRGHWPEGARGQLSGT